MSQDWSELILVTSLSLSSTFLTVELLRLSPSPSLKPFSEQTLLSKPPLRPILFLSLGFFNQWFLQMFTFVIQNVLWEEKNSHCISAACFRASRFWVKGKEAENGPERSQPMWQKQKTVWILLENVLFLNGTFQWLRKTGRCKVIQRLLCCVVL